MTTLIAGWPLQAGWSLRIFNAIESVQGSTSTRSYIGHLDESLIRRQRPTRPLAKLFTTGREPISSTVRILELSRLQGLKYPYVELNPTAKSALSGHQLNLKQCGGRSAKVTLDGNDTSKS